MIIGTAQPGRRGTFHKGARDVAENGAAVEIYPDEVALYPGSREGREPAHRHGRPDRWGSSGSPGTRTGCGALPG